LFIKLNINEFSSCANEGRVFYFNGSGIVMYGANGQCLLEFGGSVDCTNDNFGDPIENVVKHCWVSTF